MENTPAAAAPATEATPNINSNITPEVAAAPATEAPVLPTPNIPADQVEAWNKFVGANGGFEKAFSKVKQAISNPQPAPQVVEPQQPTAVSEAAVTSQPFRPAEGYITPNDISALQYSKYLAESFPTIADYVSKGEYLKEATSLGIQVMDQQGNFNDKALRGFLKLKADAVPAPAPSEPITATPTVTYMNVEGELDSREKAQQIMAQGAGHPQYQAAVNFMRQSLYPSKKAPQAPQSK